MTDEGELPPRVDEIEPMSLLIEQLERARTPSAPVLRRRVYQWLGALGADVGKLVQDARDTLAAEAKRRARHATRRRKVLQLRLERSEIPPDKLPAARRALEAAPRLIREHKRILQEIEARPLVAPNDPTLERLTHAVEPIGDQLIQPPDERWTIVKRFNWPVDDIVHLLSGPEYEAAEKYRWAFDARTARAKIGDYGDAGGSRDPAGRLPITPTQQKAGMEWQMWERQLARTPAVIPILNNFVLEQPRRGSKKPLSRVEFGKLYGGCKETHQARGVSDGMLKLACGVLAGIWSEYQDWRETQQAHIRAAAENASIRRLIAAGELDIAVREILAETRAREARAARGAPPAMARAVLETLHVQSQVFRPKRKENTTDRA